MHVCSFKDFLVGVRVGKKPTSVEWKSMAAFSRNPLPALCPRGLAGRAQSCSGFLPGRNRRAHRHPLENTVANVNQSFMNVPEEEGKRRFNGDFPAK